MDFNYTLSLLLSSEFAYFLLSSLTLAFYTYLIFLFYRKLAKRDVEPFNQTEQKGAFGIIKKTIFGFSFLVKNLILVPIYVFLWAFLIAGMVVFLTREHDINFAMLVSAVLVSTTRMLAYINEEVAMEMGKLIPLVFLATIILNPSILFSVPIGIDESLLSVVAIAPKIAVFMITVELLLRCLYEIIRTIKSAFGEKNESV
ncbi:MAG: hypothetical protein ACPL06_02105 [Candidatus Anstonellales archaeon]